MTDHKILCWGDYAIPVPLWANWMAMDENGKWHAYSDKPVLRLSLGEWDIPSFDDDYLHFLISCASFGPEPCPWNEQLYWIGDDDE